VANTVTNTILLFFMEPPVQDAAADRTAARQE
jgi:hypothetical protein